MKKITMKKKNVSFFGHNEMIFTMSTEHAAISFYRAWAPRNVGLPPVSVSDGVDEHPLPVRVFFPPASLLFLSSIRENFSFVEGRGGGRGKDNRSRRNERLWRAYIVCERQRTQHSATERRATSTKRVASVLMPQLNRHLISLDRTAVADERNWACLGVRQP